MSCINKVIDWIILLKYGGCLQSSSLQFAYKKMHSTSMCTLTMKEVVTYYHRKGGHVFSSLLDASKAFDRVRYDKLFILLIGRGLSICIIRLLLDMYMRQRVRTSWGSFVSDVFSVSNGVRQGGVLSPILFALYIDVLLLRLERSGYGCYVGCEFFGVLGSADDITLLAPTLYSLQKMLFICEDFGREFDVIWNASKSYCIFFSGKRFYVNNPADVYINGAKLSWVKQVKHLGNLVSWNLSEEAEICSKYCDFIGRMNSLISMYKNVDRITVTQLFKAQCYHLYGCQAWALDSKYIDKFDVVWRKGIRKLWYLPNTARSGILPFLVGISSVKDQAKKRFCKMHSSIVNGSNEKLVLLSNFSMYNDGIISRNLNLAQNDFDVPVSIEYKARSDSIKELSKCLEGDYSIEGFDRADIKTLIDDISSF